MNSNWPSQLATTQNNVPEGQTASITDCFKINFVEVIPPSSFLPIPRPALRLIINSPHAYHMQGSVLGSENVAGTAFLVKLGMCHQPAELREYLSGIAGWESVPRVPDVCDSKREMVRTMHFIMRPEHSPIGAEHLMLSM